MQLLSRPHLFCYNADFALSLKPPHKIRLCTTQHPRPTTKAFSTFPQKTLLHTAPCSGITHSQTRLNAITPPFERISSEFLQKSPQKHINAVTSFKIVYFLQKRRFRAMFCVVFIFCHFCRKSAFFALKTHFFAHFSASVAFCKKRRPNAPFLSFYAFLSLFATISSINRSSENTVEMPVGGGNDITLSKCRSSPAR